MGMLKKIVDLARTDGGSIRTRVLRSGVWVGLSEALLGVMGGLRSVALARLLSPEVFGLMGLANVAIRTVETLTRPGVMQALIARQGNFEDSGSTAFTLLVGRGALLTLVLAAVAPWIAAFYEEDELESVLACLSLIFLLGGLSNINTIARQRELDFRQLTYIKQAASLISTIATIAIAFWYRSVWALVIGQLTSAATTVVCSYYFVEGRPTFRLNSAVARQLLSYGKFITGSSIVLFVARELDSAVIGKLLGTRELGYYSLAAMVAFLPTGNVSKIASIIMMPAYSKLQSDPSAVRRAYCRVLAVVMLFVLPASVGLFVLAEPLIQVIFGDKWLPAAIPLQVLTLFGLLRALTSFSGFLFEGIGKPKAAFLLGLIRLLVIAPAIVPMIKFYGLLGAALTVTVGIAAQWLAGLVFLRKFAGITVAQLMGSIWQPLWTTVLMGFAACTLTLAVDARSLAGLATVVVASAILYGALNFRTLMALKREGLA